MLNLLAATGDINYARGARLHLQNMPELQINYPWVYTHFIEHGCHTGVEVTNIGEVFGVI